MIDHVGFAVSDYARSKAFYERALAPLGLTVLLEPKGQAAGFGRDGKPIFWLETHGQVAHGIHVAFTAADRATVDAFHAAALAAGGTDNGAPGIRELYHPDYYGAYVLTADGVNLEAVCHRPE
jgi:catechol 2,3-dioxygenase-like lactoylglutathione lyase family enzyme